VHPDDQPKIATFCPGAGFGSFENCRMPFGLCGAPASFQRLMNTVYADLPIVTTNLDDLLVHSASKQDHARLLDILFHKMSLARLAFQGFKHHVGLSQVPYLDHVLLSETSRKLMLSVHQLSPQLLKVSKDLHPFIDGIFPVLQTLQLPCTT